MATIIDSLIVELGLDPSKLEEGQKKAVESLRKFESGAKQHLTPAKTEVEKVIDAFSALQGRLLAVGSIIAAGLGFNRLVEDATKANTELGNMSKSLAVSAQELAKWEAAGKTVGATANEMAQAYAAIQDALSHQQTVGGNALTAFSYTTHQTGQGPAVELFNPDGSKRSPNDILLSMSKWYEAQQDKAVASYLLRSQAGVSQGMVNMLALGPNELKKRLDFAKQFAPSDEQIKQFQKLTEAFGEFSTVVGKLETLIAASFTPALTKILNLMTEWLGKIALGKNPADVAGEQAAKSGFPELKPIPGKPSWSHRFWNWMTGHTDEPAAAGAPGGAGGPGGAGAPGGAGGAGGIGGSGTGGASATSDEGSSEYLRGRRQRYLDEINNTPGLKDRVGGMLALEGTPQPTMEALLNRMDYVNSEREAKGLPPITIDRMLTSGFYGPINNGRLDEGIASYRQNQGKYDRAMNRVFGGSHRIGGFTDQGLPSDPNGWRQPQVRVGDNVFPDWNGGGPLGAGDYRNAAAYRQRVENAIANEQAQAAARASTPANVDRMPAWLPSVQGQKSLAEYNGIDRTFNNWSNLNIGARGAMNRSGDSTVNTNTSSTHIDEMHVTVPPGADAAAYGAGIRQELKRYDTVQHSNTGLR